MAEYINPCDLCQNRDICADDTDNRCVLAVYARKNNCTQYDCFINYDGSCSLGFYENCGAWEG